MKDFIEVTRAVDGKKALININEIVRVEDQSENKLKKRTVIEDAIHNCNVNALIISTGPNGNEYEPSSGIATKETYDEIAKLIYYAQDYH